MSKKSFRNITIQSSKTFSSNQDETPKINEEEPIIGIDLGTTYCCVAIFKNNIPQIIVNKSGKRTTPSLITINKNEILFGDTAKNVMFINSENTMKDSKRLIGRFFKDPEVQKDIKYFPIKIIEDPYTKKPQYLIKNNETEKYYFPIDISSLILKEIKSFATNGIGKEIKKAIITVPAHFNNFQREETKEAAKKAGLEVIKIINEPTAAAIAYGFENKNNKERKVLIFDLGGGTFDVSILKIKGSEYYVLSSCGDAHLGGEDFNQRLIDYVLNQFKKEKKFENVDFYDKNNVKAFKALQRIRKETEEIKIQLSFQNEVNYDIDSLYKEEDFQFTINRINYEELCKDLFDKCFVKIDEALKLAKLEKNNIDEIVLVGGSSRTPKIQKMIEEYFNLNEKDEKEENKKIKKNINPDEVIAQGAALFAYFGKNVYENNDFFINAKLFEITSLSIGIEVALGQMKTIIPKGTSIPCSFKEYFNTPNNTNKIIIKVYEGEDIYTSGNHLLGKFIISDFRNVNEKNVKIEIEMNIDNNSILSVVANVQGKKNNSIQISKTEFYDNIEAQVYEEKNKWIRESRIKINEFYTNNNNDKK